MNIADSNYESPRRAARVRNRPKKYGDFLEHSPTKRRIDITYSSEDEEFSEAACPQKPTALFSNDDVEGQDIFKFKSWHSKLDLQNRVKSTISKSPKISKSSLTTPKKYLSKGSVSSPLHTVSEATPKHVKDIIKQRIIQEVDSDSASDYSGSTSDFVPDESEDESSATLESSASASEEEEHREIKQSATKKQIMKNQMKPKDSEYFVTPDNYFMMHSSKKITTSDHTLARLKNMNLNDHQSKDIEISQEHKTQIFAMNQSHEQLFTRWFRELRENFSILLYGIGSKLSLVQKFQSQMLQGRLCVVVNGFFPSLTMKSVLDSIVVDLLKNAHVPSNIADIVHLIDTQLADNDEELFLIIHNIDGAMLRNAKAQSILANISHIEKVHTISTTDHINGSLLWDHTKLSKFNFTWWDVTTFLPYSEETSFENTTLTQRSGVLQLSLQSVYKSLTTNSKGIFNIIIRHQLENNKQPHYQGLPFKDLYSKSREQFLASSDLALRAQLTEFLDHKLVKMKRSYDGNENLIIPIENVLLQQFLEQNS